MLERLMLGACAALLFATFGTACSDNQSYTDLCEDAVDHTAPCCGLSSSEVDGAKEACGQSISDAQAETLECVLDTSCEQLLAGQCGGIRCFN